MNRINIYKDIYASLIKFCQDVIQATAAEGWDFQYLNLDAHASDSEWPQGDFIGTSDVKIDVDEFDTVILAFVVGTENDTNLFRLSEVVNYMVNLLLPGKSIPVYDSQTGILRANLMSADGLRIGSTSPTEKQTVQPIMVRLLCDHRNL